MTTTYSQRLEQEIESLGSDIFAQIESHSRSRLDPQFYTDKLMEYAMQDEALKISLFRFVDVLPALESSASVIQHVHEYFEPVKDRIPGFLQKGFKVSPDSLTSVMVARAIKQQVRFIADRFIVGETPDKALSTLRKIRKNGQAFTVDLVGEAALGKAECRAYLDKYLDLIRKLGKASEKWPESKAIVEGHKGEITPINISVKLSALYSQATPLSTETSIGEFHEQLSEILAAAKEVGAYVFVDMEDTSLVEATLGAVKKTLTHPVFRDYARCGIVLQAYLRRTEADFEALLPWVRQRGVPLGVRLVKGAYWDTETILARQKNWPIPVWQSKSCSDAVYERLSTRLLEEREVIFPAFASHNVRSLVHACSAAKLMEIPKTEFELQSLYGMAPEIKRAFAQRGYLVREYSPIGELIPAMGYLVRRLLENTSNEGFLRRSTYEKTSAALLLKAPQFDTSDTGTDHLKETEEFQNLAFTDFSIPELRAEFAEALKHEKNQAQRVVTGIVDGKQREYQDTLLSTSPENPALALARVHLATKTDAEEAIASLKDFFPEYRRTPLEQRTAVLRRAADLMIERRAAICATITLECGKPLTEADADLAEAVDFCRFYAQQAEEKLAIHPLPSPAGEKNSYWFEPRGVSAVICPWNFPLAIPCGMFSASLVCGNCVLLKPAEQSSLTAKLLFEIFLEAGMPPAAAAFVPGRGEEVGALLADHPDIATICFTGSKEVGLKLIEQGAKSESFGRHVRKVVAEMGGKNATIVDEDADLDEAVKGVLHGAFNYAGQKCSACSRVIVIRTAYERFCARLRDALLSIHVGPASEPKTLVPPVIDSESANRLRAAIAEAKESCTVLAEHPFSSIDHKDAHFIPPIAFVDVPQGHPLHRQELFGPVLIVEFADSIDEAIRAAMDTEYALTGAVFSRSPETIRYALEHFRVGNLYLNRGSTGALVARQPFGGAAMSGVGSKAGGYEYLLQFVIPRSATENTIRRGFAPLNEGTETSS